MSVSGATEVPAVRTGRPSGVTQADWIRSRWIAAVREIASRGASWSVAALAAAALVTHWARETGMGSSEWGYNIGNIRCFRHPTCHVLSDRLDYRAYPSLDEGVKATIDLASRGRYSGAWDYLIATGDGLGWYDRLMRAGWHPWSQQGLDEFRSVNRRVVAAITTGPVVLERRPTWVQALGGGLLIAFGFALSMRR